jgi:hypothetical protein
VPLDATRVGGDGRRFLRSSAFPENEAGLQIREIPDAQLLHSDRLVIELAILDGIITPGDPTELHLRFAARRLRRPSSVKPNCVATRATACSILDDVAAFA